jgi:hypothetical protein
MGNHCCRCFGFGGKDSNDLEETLIASTNTSDAVSVDGVDARMSCSCEAARAGAETAR